MANEFKIKNGLLVDQGTSQITGSLLVSGSTTITGSLTISGSIFNTTLPDSTGSGHVLMYNTSSGQFSYTASSAIGGGNASNDNFQQLFLLMGG
jgi:hypothetical protein